MSADPAEQAANLEPDRELETEREPDTDPTFEPPPLREDIDTGDDGDEHRGHDEQAVETDGNDHVTPEKLEQRAKRTETSFKTYARAVERNYESDFAYLADCPLCPDQHKGFVDVRHAGLVPDEIQNAVRMYFGVAREKDYAHSQTTRTCPECEGEGKVATGSHVPAHVTITCPSCKGYGYVPPPGHASSNGHEDRPLTGPLADLPVTQAYEEVDEWDEPRILPDGRENPNFGKMPNRKILVEPWGVTAGLNAMSA